MRYTYGTAVCTFNGAHRVKACLDSLDLVPSMKQMSKKLVIEDKTPPEGLDNHNALVEIVNSHPGWELVSMEEWGNMQGCADRALKECTTDFVWYVSDDIITLGDPLKYFMVWAEQAPKDILDNTGTIGHPIYHAVTHLANPLIGWLKPSSFAISIHNEFFNDPLNTWAKDKGPVQFDTHFPMVPAMSGEVNGAAFILKRDAWREVGGFDKKWDALDQEICYSIYTETPRIIYTLPGDPVLHGGGCAQNSSFIGLRPVSAYNHGDARCKEIFGLDIAGIEEKAHKICGERAQIWQPRMIDAWRQITDSNGWPFRWRWL
jgi:hypothetical protein